VIGVARSGGVDLLDAAAVRETIADARPEVVYHLAARAHVGDSWRRPDATVRDNVAMTANLLEAVRIEAPTATVLAVGSSEVYGVPDRLPIEESALLQPQNPYATSKAMVDMLAAFYADAYGLRVVRTRSFNHAGPGQEPTYAIASFARQVASGGRRPRVVTGNPNARRDYTDVRDVVRAYRLLAERGAPGVCNVCSGRSSSAVELIALLAEAADAEVEHEVDPALLRPNEVMELRGSFDALHAATGWEPEIPLTRTVADTLSWWTEEIRAGRPAARLHE
jgi:GDP-4-dehydro-6-deoxy-D-mannose reductase